MALIEFQDLPNTTTPLTASNLNKIQEANIYSTNEIEIGDWFGDTLYRKGYVIQAGNLVYNSWATIQTDSNYKIKKWSGWYYRSNNRADGFAVGGDIDYDPLIMTIRNTNIEYRISTDYQQDGIEAVFIIEYTKQEEE